VPAEEPLRGERFGEILDRAERRLDDPFDSSVSRRKRASVNAETTSNRGPNLVAVRQLALDLAGFDDILGQSGNQGPAPQGTAQAFHDTADQPSLPVPDGREMPRRRLVIPAEVGPIRQFANVFHYILRASCGDYADYSLQSQGC
jgi:hypothetical protein